MYNNDSNSLNAGAPDIRLSGNQQMASAPDPMAELNLMYQNALQSGQIAPGTTLDQFKLLLEQSQAPQQDSGIMAAAPTGTYTQQRKNNMMAYGGIAGADGRKKYGIGSFFQKYVKDPIEVALTGKSFADLERESQARVDEEDRLYGEGYQNPFDTFLKGAPAAKADELVSQYLGTGDQYDVLNMFGLGATDTSGEDTGILPFGLSNLGIGNISLKPYLKYKQTIREPVKATSDRFVQTGRPDENVFVPGTPAQPGEYRQTERVNPLYPIAAGLGVGKYVSGLPKDKLPMDTTSIDPAAIAAAAQGTDAQGIAAGLRFLPEQVTRAAEGGRIGFAGGGNYEDFEQFMKEREQMYRGMDKENILKDFERYKRFKQYGPGAIQEAAQGGRIGYQDGEGVESIPTDQMQSIQGQQAGGEYNRVMELMLKIKENIPLTEDEQFELRELMKTLNMSEAPGRDRVMAQEGGLMDLGGMEKDYRNEGGFVALGGEEKADDVPARLSKNEFVFTADAVRGAGGGDIDQGAEIMENMMKNLEAGGEVSEDSQGLEGARGMFANAQKLQNRII